MLEMASNICSRYAEDTHEYRKHEAKEYAKTALKGVWTALHTTYAGQQARRNRDRDGLEHCISD